MIWYTQGMHFLVMAVIFHEEVLSPSTEQIDQWLPCVMFLLSLLIQWVVTQKSLLMGLPGLSFISF